MQIYEAVRHNDVYLQVINCTTIMYFSILFIVMLISDQLKCV